MSTMIKEKEAEQDILEQNIIEKKLAKASKAEKPTVEKKKGQPVNWKPASRLPKLTAPEGFKPKWAHNTPERVRQLQAEGWEIANRLEHKMDVEMGDYYRKVNDKPGSEASSNITHNEMIAMVAPDEVIAGRKEYHRNETEQQTRTKLQPEKSASAFMQNMAKFKTTMEIN